MQGSSAADYDTQLKVSKSLLLALLKIIKCHFAWKLMKSKQEINLKKKHWILWKMVSCSLNELKTHNTHFTQQPVWAFNCSRHSLVELIYFHVCVLIFCYCYVCRLGLLGFLSSSVIAVWDCSWVNVMQVCVQSVCVGSVVYVWPMMYCLLWVFWGVWSDLLNWRTLKIKVSVSFFPSLTLCPLYLFFSLPETSRNLRVWDWC